MIAYRRYAANPAHLPRSWWSGSVRPSGRHPAETIEREFRPK